MKIWKRKLFGAADAVSMPKMEKKKYHQLSNLSLGWDHGLSLSVLTKLMAGTTVYWASQSDGHEY